MYANDHSPFPQYLADLPKVHYVNDSKDEQPLYSCQAPHGYGHIYQCPVHFHGEKCDQKHHTEHGQHHIDPGGNLAIRELKTDHKQCNHENSLYNMKNQNDCQHTSTDQNLTRNKPWLDHSVSLDQVIELSNLHIDPGKKSVYIRGSKSEFQEQLEDQGKYEFQDIPMEYQRIGQADHLDSTLDQQSGYVYSSSDYSSTEPIYSQSQIYNGRPCAHTPTIYCNKQMGSLRAMRSYGGAPATFLSRADPYCNSTVSSTLPTVSAQLTQDYSTYTTPITTHSIQSLQANMTSLNKRRESLTPTKHHRKSILRTWKLKFQQGEGRHKKVCLLAALVFLIILVFGILTAILYLAIAGDISSLLGGSPRLIEVAKKGCDLVTGEFSITNQNFQPAFSEHLSMPYRSIVKSIENELDVLFSGSVWSPEYNRSHLVALLPIESLSAARSGLFVQVKLFLNSDDVASAQKLRSAFLRGLDSRHGHDWLGPYAINITSIRFMEDLKATSTLPSTTSSLAPENFESHQDSAFSFQSTPYLNVGWSSWGPWSTCSSCSHQFDQTRTRQCRLSAGLGLLISNVEPCLTHTADAQNDDSDGNSDEEIETRPCQCYEYDQDHEDIITTTPKTTITTYSVSHSMVPTTTTTDITSTTTTTHSMMDKNQPDSLHHCQFCLVHEVCVALEDETHPTCREPTNIYDQTGCGGLCMMDSEVCQALGSRAFSCHSALKCLHDEWRCDDGLCIPYIKRCDGHMNCYDRSDEVNCEDSSSMSSISSTGRWQISGMGQMNPGVPFGIDNSQAYSNKDELHMHHHNPFVLGGTRVPVPVLNKTAIGLSSLSHRERELLS
ncbi:unnamed protein product [Meganyctiphanes norvegica]|uniref:SEA domain-containing protein n=1 Tax=Meganyctiphanes norvegica TaxID=48144 RepID=A0AAV2RG14_MEGNR